jgi:hypothetical protein
MAPNSRKQEVSLGKQDGIYGAKLGLDSAVQILLSIYPLRRLNLSLIASFLLVFKSSYRHSMEYAFQSLLFLCYPSSCLPLWRILVCQKSPRDGQVPDYLDERLFCEAPLT